MKENSYQKLMREIHTPAGLNERVLFAARQRAAEETAEESGPKHLAPRRRAPVLRTAVCAACALALAIHYLVGLTYHLGYSSEYLAVVYLDAYTYAKAAEHGIHYLHELHLIEQRVAAHHIGIALIELPVASLLRAVGSPHGLNLIALEGQSQFVTVLHHIAGKGHCEVIAQSLFAEMRCQPLCAGMSHLVSRHAMHEVA